MTVAGSDSGGGAGIQADLKAFAALGVFGTSAITCITAQNPGEVRGILGVRPGMVALQIETVCRAFQVKAAKTGMLYSAAIIKSVSAALAKERIGHIVVDPVMVATSGARLLRPDAQAALRERILPMAEVITPNMPEAEALCAHPVRTLPDMEKAAREIGLRYRASCVVKGGHLEGKEAIDVLFHEGKICHLRSGRLKVLAHGTGCSFSAALAAELAKGLSVPAAAERAKRFVHGMLKFLLIGTA